MALTQSVLSLQYVLVPVRARASGASYDPTSDVVKMAFPATGVNPISGDWKTADWESRGNTHYVRCLVGPGGTVVLAAGTFDVWVKITDNPEVPALKADTLTIQ